MPRYAVMNGMHVANIILAEDVHTAQEVTGKVCIEAPDFVSLGYVYVNDMFYREHIVSTSDGGDMKLLETENPIGTDLGTPKVDGYVGYDELNTKMEENIKQEAEEKGLL